MDRVEQFIREGVAEAKSPWVVARRKTLFPALFWGVLALCGFLFGRADMERAVIYLGIFFVAVGLSFMRTVIGQEFHTKIKAWKYWRGAEGDGSQFLSAHYPKAAQALREFAPSSYSEAVEKYGEDTVGLLLLSDGIFFNDGELKRLVSIKAIEEDREAGMEDE